MDLINIQEQTSYNNATKISRSNAFHDVIEVVYLWHVGDDLNTRTLILLILKITCRMKDVFLVCVACFVFCVLAFVDFLNMVIEGEQRMISRYGCI